MTGHQDDLLRANHQIGVLGDRIIELQNLVLFFRVKPMESLLYNEKPPFKKVADKLEATKERLIGEREELMELVERLKEILERKQLEREPGLG